VKRLSGRLAPVALIGLVVVLGVAAIGMLASSGWPASEYRDRDFIQFRVGAKALLHGDSPYDATTWRALHAEEGSRFLEIQPVETSGPPYPLWTLFVALPFALPSLAVSAAAWLVVQLVLVCAGIAVLMGRLGALRDRAAVLLVVLITASFQPVLYLIANGSVTGFVCAALAFSVAAAIGRAPHRAGAFLALTLLKPQSLVVAAAVIVAGLDARSRRSLLAAALAVASALALASFILVPTWPVDAAAAAIALQTSTGSNATGWTLGRVVGGPAASVASVFALVLAFAIWWRRRAPEYRYLIAAVVPVSVFVSPHGWSHEQLYLLVSAVIVAASVAALRGRERLLGGVALLLIFAVLPWALFNSLDEAASAFVPIAVFALVVAIETLSRSPASIARSAWTLDPARADS
jgi:MFS family permease